jgi:hypothetical protein
LEIGGTTKERKRGKHMKAQELWSRKQGICAPPVSILAQVSGGKT